jgi:hypothetical protein
MRPDESPGDKDQDDLTWIRSGPSEEAEPRPSVAPPSAEHPSPPAPEPPRRGGILDVLRRKLRGR